VPDSASAYGAAFSLTSGALRMNSPRCCSDVSSSRTVQASSRVPAHAGVIHRIPRLWRQDQVTGEFQPERPSIVEMALDPGQNAREEGRQRTGRRCG